MASAKRSGEIAFGPETSVALERRDAPHRSNPPEPFFFGSLQPSQGPPRPLPARGLARVPSELEVLEAELTRSNADLVLKDADIAELKRLLQDGYRRVASAEKNYLELVESLSGLVQSAGGNAQGYPRIPNLLKWC